MTATYEEQYKVAPGSLALIQALVNTQHGKDRRAHSELTNPEQLRAWLIANGLQADDVPITEGDFRRALQLREALRGLLRANNAAEILPAAQIEVLNHLVDNAPLTVRFHADGLPTLEPDIAGVDGALGRLVSIVFTAMTDSTWPRLKICRNERCQKTFYDTSRNRSGAWCSMADCGSRLKATAYRHRHALQRERMTREIGAA